MERPAGPAPTRCADLIRAAILDGTFAPGEVLRQSQLASQLGMSHIPLREGLRILETQGFVRHLPNIGYTVAQLSVEDFRQIHIMRQALETEILRALPVLDAATLKSLKKTNRLMQDALHSRDMLLATQMNKKFHLTMFHHSSVHLILREVERLWAMFDPYRRMYLWKARSLDSIIEEHEEMIEVAAEPDRTRMIRLMNQHRNRSFDVLSRALTGATEGQPA